MKIRKGITIDLQDLIIKWSYEFFKDHMDFLSFTYHIQQTTNWEESIIIMDGKKIMGVYLFGDTQLNGEYKVLRGIEGVLLAVDETIRGQGWGNKLKDYPKTLEIDYIWGYQLKSLGNLNDWLKRRKLLYQTDDCYVTIEIF